jgi:hypothetical protein
MITEEQRRELAALMNRNRTEVSDGELRLVCRSPEDFERAYELLSAQGREPERCIHRRLITCSKKRST